MAGSFNWGATLRFAKSCSTHNHKEEEEEEEEVGRGDSRNFNIVKHGAISYPIW